MNSSLSPVQPSSHTSSAELHNFFTTASIRTPTGNVCLERVQVDERSPFNFIPWSIATTLNLILYSGKELTVTTPHYQMQTTQYSKFTIRVANYDTTIYAGVISELRTVLLGREWMHSAQLSASGNRNYYIPLPLSVEIAERKLFHILDAEIAAEAVKTFGPEGSNHEHPSNKSWSSPDHTSNGRILPDYASDAKTPDRIWTEGRSESGGAPESNNRERSPDRSSYGRILPDYASTDATISERASFEDGSDREGGEQDYNCYEELAYGQCAGCEECEIFESYEPGSQSVAAGEMDRCKESSSQGLQGITDQQSDEIMGILTHISRTPAAKSFEAPVERLWPEFAAAYAATVLNPIDLGNIQLKVHNRTYPSIDALRADVSLLYRNSVDFNGINHPITSSAAEVRDMIFNALNDIKID